jgi:hypothetical protein
MRTVVVMVRRSCPGDFEAALWLSADTHLEQVREARMCPEQTVYLRNQCNKFYQLHISRQKRIFKQHHSAALAATCHLSHL